MQRFLVGIVYAVIFTMVGGALEANALSKKERHNHKIPHIMPDAESSEYLALYDKAGRPRGATDLQFAIKLGERNLKWLNHMNSFRPDGQKIQLTKPGQLKGIPIDAPSKYSPETIKTDYDSTYRDMPVDMAKILYSSVPFTENPPIPEDEYVIWAKKVDRNYQTAVRWTLMEPYLGYLEMRRADDLRGFYFLSKKTNDVEETLKNFSSQTPELQEQIKTWLSQMCTNNEGLSSDCVNTVDQSEKAGTLLDLFKKYLPGSQNIWNQYFSLENPRPEITWSSKVPNLMSVPFMDPKNDSIKNFLITNIEDEFKWNNWNLKLKMLPQAQIHVEFQSGVTPHVNGAGGDTITMDANSPLTEWDTQWTIRHEFGHVLGFVDCYLEFYDVKEKAIVNYQLDVDHLMCSRAGRMQQSIFDTLKTFYFK